MNYRPNEIAPAATGANRPYTLVVYLETWQKLMAYVQSCPVEICGYGYIDRLGEHDFFLREVFILDQEVGPGHAIVHEHVLSAHITNMVQRGLNAGDMRFQWHSHGNGGAYFSTTDTSNIENYGGGWMISLVANKIGDYNIRLDMLKPFAITAPVEVKILHSPSRELMAQVAHEIGEKVRQPRRVLPPKPVAAGDTSVVISMPGTPLMNGAPA